MPERVDLPVRRSGHSHAEFAERWQGGHADPAKDLPGPRRYVTSVPTQPQTPGTTACLTRLETDD
jgi:hypothetical protein